jgi:hypothetical protein
LPEAIFASFKRELSLFTQGDVFAHSLYFNHIADVVVNHGDCPLEPAHVAVRRLRLDFARYRLAGFQKSVDDFTRFGDIRSGYGAGNRLSDQVFAGFSDVIAIRLIDECDYPVFAKTTDQVRL